MSILRRSVVASGGGAAGGALVRVQAQRLQLARRPRGLLHMRQSASLLFKWDPSSTHGPQGLQVEVDLRTQISEHLQRRAATNPCGRFGAHEPLHTRTAVRAASRLAAHLRARGAVQIRHIHSAAFAGL